MVKKLEGSDTYIGGRRYAWSGALRGGGEGWQVGLLVGKGADAGVCGFSLGRLGDWMRRVSKGGRASGAGVVGTRLGSGYGGGSLRGGGGRLGG